jgi:hypothetical protein
VLGFVPGVTTNYDELTFANHHRTAKLLGNFQVSVLHNIVHLLFGIVGLLLACKAATAGPTSSAAGWSTRCSSSTG